MTPSEFYNINPVFVENDSNNFEGYYLTKTGKIVGRDSICFFDQSPDFEKEGFIRFQDYKLDKVGVFNRNGDVVIPADYSCVSKVMNGMFVVLKGAERHWAKGHEHYSWVGGKEYLIDTNNRVVIENFSSDSYLNFNSIKISKVSDMDTVRVNFLGVNGMYYSFIDYNKEFKKWVSDIFLKNLSIDNLLKYMTDTIEWSSRSFYGVIDKQTFVSNNIKNLTKEIRRLKSSKTDYSIFDEHFDISDDPVFRIVINNKNLTQDHFTFIFTKDGYKINDISIRKFELQ